MLFLCSFSTISAFSRGVAMKILAAVGFDGANTTLLYLQETPHIQMSFCSITFCFPWQRSIVVICALSRVAPVWPQGSDWNHSSRQACSLSLFKAVIPVHWWGCDHAVPVSGVAVSSWTLLQPRCIPGAARHHQLITLSCAHQIQSIFRERVFGSGGEFPEICVWVSATWLLLTLMGVTLLGAPWGYAPPDVCALLHALALRGRAHLCPALSRRKPPVHPCPHPSGLVYLRISNNGDSFLW